MSRTQGSLNQKTIDNVRRFLAGDTSVPPIPAKVMQVYMEHYVNTSPDPQDLQDAVEMTFTPEDTTSVSMDRHPPQHANPADDVIPDEDGGTPHGETENQSKPFTKDPTLGVSEDFGEQADDNHEDAFLSALEEQMSAGATYTEAEHAASNTPNPVNPQPTSPVQSPPIKVGSIKVANTIRVEQDTPMTQESNVVHYGSPGWTNYILNNLTPVTEKIIDKNGQVRPRCMGLRRMVETHIGVILSTKMKIVASPNKENRGIWAIMAKVTMKVTNQNHHACGEIIKWTDIANSFADGQQPDIVTNNPVASAYTAALSRCFRSILGLSGVYASEEMENKGTPQPCHNPDGQLSMQQLTGNITDKQIKIIETTCKRYKADVMAVVRDVCKDNTINSLQNLSAQEGFEVASAVNAFQSSPVPPNWKL
jgi:hypothetical protein